ncbi:MAG: hypothetical protein WC084_06365, partial [Synergistaceae bacterium]
MKKYKFLILSLLFTSCTLNLPAHAALQNALPEAIGKNISAVFRPESAAVTVKGQTAWIEINGGTIDGIRIDKMKLFAILQDVSARGGSTDSAS